MDIPYRNIIRDILDFLCRWPLDIIPRKRWRRRGKRGRLINRVKSYLRTGIPPSLCPLPRTTDYWRFVVRQSTVQSLRWLRYTLPAPRALPDSTWSSSPGPTASDLHSASQGVSMLIFESVSKTPVSRNTLRSPKNGADQRSFSG